MWHIFRLTPPLKGAFLITHCLGRTGGHLQKAAYKHLMHPNNLMRNRCSENIPAVQSKCKYEPSTARPVGNFSLTELGGGCTFFCLWYPNGQRRYRVVGFVTRDQLVDFKVNTQNDISERLMTLRVPPVKSEYAIFWAATPQHWTDQNNKKFSFIIKFS